MFKKPLIILIFFLSGFILFQNVLAECTEGQININTAPAEDLDKITQIGPTTAAKIIEARNIKLFESLDDLLNVKGIGLVTLDKIKQEELACVGSTDSSQVPPTSTFTDSTATTTPSTNEQAATSTEPQSTSSDDNPNNQRPSAEAGKDIITNVNMPIHFDGSQSSDSENDELLYTWNLGNGDYRDQQSFDYVYQIPGRYVVTLEVNDRHLIDTDSILIEVYPQAVFISEFLADPETDEEKNEWIEIGNFSNYLVDISGWQLGDGGTSTRHFVFPHNTFILPNAFMVVPRTLTKITLNNDRDKVRLFYPSGELADEINYEKTKKGLSAAKKGDDFFWTKILTPGMQNLIFLDEEMVKKTSKANEILVKENNLSIKQNKLTLNNAVVRVGKSGQSISLIGKKDYQVSLPTLADLDDLLTIETVFAKSEFSGKIEEEKKSAALSGGQDFSFLDNHSLSALQQKPEKILLGTTLISSILFGFWGVILRRRFFS